MNSHDAARRKTHARAAGTGNSEFLLTPGPLTTSLSVKQAMLRDWGSRDKQFIALNKRIRERLVAIAGGGDSFVCVPVQGSGTFAVEATLGTLVPRDGRLLVLVNGAYGERMVKIMKYLGKVVSQYLLENLVSAGADRIFIILGDGKSDIMRYYGDGQRFGTNITYLYQENLNGMPSAIDLARYWLKDDTVLFGMPDTIIEPRNSFEMLLDYHHGFF